MTNIINFDVVIVGAGPAGCSCAINLAHSGLRIAVIDKEEFPREKICSGGIAERSINVMKRMPDDLYQNFHDQFKKNAYYGIRIFSSNGNYCEFIDENSENILAYFCKRVDYDNFLYSALSKYRNITTFTEKITDIIYINHNIQIKTESKEIDTKIIVGADGAHSVVAAKLASINQNNKYHFSAITRFYENISGFENRVLPEFHFLKDFPVCYLWIFPYSDNQFSVGLGGQTSIIKEKKVILRSLLTEIIESHPLLSVRFKNAKYNSDFKSWGLPLGGRKLRISGNNFLLTGDAASLVDPLTGEGIGNALLSGEIAANHIMDCFKTQNFSDHYMEKYDNNIYKRLMSEFIWHQRMSGFFNYQFISNFFINKINRNKYFHQLLTDSLEKKLKRKKFLNPFLLLRLLIP